MSSNWQALNVASQVLKARIAQQTIHTANIANIETPNYKAKVPEFSAELDKITKDVDPSKIKINITDSADAVDEKGNNVQIEKEMASMTHNSLAYLTTLKIMTKELAIMKYSLGG